MTEAQAVAGPHRPVVGVAGPADLVEEIIELGAGMAGRPVDCRLVGVAFADEHDVAREFARVRGEIDACLFTGPLPYDVARRSGVVSVPATYIPLSGSALYGTLLRAALTRRFDLGRVSVDSVPAAEIGQAYQDIHVRTDGVQVMAYRAGSSPAEFVAFHERLWRTGATTLALTGVPAVAQRLAAVSVPAMVVRPTRAVIRDELRHAALLGLGSRLEESQIAIGIVALPAGAAGGGQHEHRVAVQRTLSDEARRMGATVLPRDERSYYLVATLGSLVAATDDFRVPPFVDRVRDEFGVDVELGIGLGLTARDAEANARVALGRGRGSTGGQGYVVGHDGNVLLLPEHPRARQEAHEEARCKALGTLGRLADALRAAEFSPVERPVVDASTVAELLDITPRAARRVLHALAEMGLAWQLPPLRTAGPGRPRQLYRLVVEKLDAPTPVAH
ncbi:hypothetical protein GCM10012275_03080 [Longimycelium tulufanense]|uniref:Transcriptional regulator n=1 Tax=Longimycelium tulufanense TaxID=907463 RepID=A0A8J3FT33_9PSEU|nr:GTP cyclohydrolase IIa [Longimycelium tulufanense]GGM35223.1 hypothetical protein GCM10012275_03080 [Longimycelium tulufanense]